MREILFKAKRIDNGEWVEGMPVVLPSKEKATMVCSHRIWEDDAVFASHCEIIGNIHDEELRGEN